MTSISSLTSEDKKKNLSMVFFDILELEIVHVYAF